jgi:ATP-binding cassette subfamily B protein
LLTLTVVLVRGTAVSLVGTHLKRILIDHILTPATSGGNGLGSIPYVYKGSPRTALVIMALIMASLLTLGTGISIVRGRISVWLGARVGMELRARVFHHLQTLSLGYFDKQKTGALMARTDHDTRRLEDFLIEGVPFTVISIFELVGITALLFAWDWRLAAWAMLPVPLLLGFSAIFWRFIYRMFRRLWERVSKLSAFLNDSISGVRVVKAFGQEEREKERFDGHNISLFEGNIRVGRTFATFMPFLWFVMLSGTIVMWYVGGLGAIAGRITLGTLVMFVEYLWRLYRPLQMLTRLNSWLTRSLTSAERVFEVLDVAPEVTDAPDAVPVPAISRSRPAR